MDFTRVSFCEMNLQCAKEYNYVNSMKNHGYFGSTLIQIHHCEKWTSKENQNSKNVLHEKMVWKYNSFLSILTTGHAEFKTSYAKWHESQ
jgi:hypothetical protein